MAAARVLLPRSIWTRRVPSISTTASPLFPIKLAALPLRPPACLRTLEAMPPLPSSARSRVDREHQRLPAALHVHAAGDNSSNRCSTTPLSACYLTSPTRAGPDPAISDASSPNSAVKFPSPSLAHALPLGQDAGALLRPCPTPCICFIRALTMSPLHRPRPSSRPLHPFAREAGQPWPLHRSGLGPCSCFVPIVRIYSSTWDRLLHGFGLLPSGISVAGTGNAMIMTREQCFLFWSSCYASSSFEG